VLTTCQFAHEGAKKKEEKREPEVYYWFGYKLHLVVDAFYELPLAFTLTPANEADTTYLKPLLQKASVDQEQTRSEVVSTDKGYDSQENNT
jgi:IS5 family transposase